MTDELRSRLEECQIGIASRGQKQPDDTFLSPHLWEQLRQRLQGVYRRATGETHAVLSIDAPAPAEHVRGIESNLAVMLQDLIGDLDSLPWLPEDITDKMSRFDLALEKVKALPPTDLTNDQKEITLLRIIEASGGETDSSESKWNWLNWFCSDEVHREHSDTFNRCHEKGWLHTTHNSDTDASTTTLTAAGRASLSQPMADKRTKCHACGGRGYFRCDCWPADCICGQDEDTCFDCDGEGLIDPTWDDDYGVLVDDDTPPPVQREGSE